MSGEKLISVIVPIYKVEKYLPKCIDSILNQTYKNLEIILVDDGSPDRCPQICDEYAKRDSRVRVIHKANGGLSDARNVGIEAANGEYIGFVDSDDYLHLQMYEKLALALESNYVDMVICPFVFVDEQENFINILEEKSEILSNLQGLSRLIERKHAGNYVTATNKLYKIKLFTNIRFPKGKIHEDQFVAFKLMEKCSRIAVIPESLYYYVQRNGSITSQGMSVKAFDNIEALCEFFFFLWENGYKELGIQESQYMIMRYTDIILFIEPSTAFERDRIMEIQQMLKNVLSIDQVRQGLSIKRRMLIKYPLIFVWLLRKRRKIFVAVTNMLHKTK